MLVGLFGGTKKITSQRLFDQTQASPHQGESVTFSPFLGPLV